MTQGPIHLMVLVTSLALYSCDHAGRDAHRSGEQALAMAANTAVAAHRQQGSDDQAESRAAERSRAHWLWTGAAVHAAVKGLVAVDAAHGVQQTGL